MKKLICAVLAILTVVSAAPAVCSAASPFSDVTEDRWSSEAIGYAYEMKYMEGVGGGRFDPTGTMTRAMVVTVLWRRDGSPEAEDGGFTDITDEKWYATAVGWAKESGVVKGTTETTFSPDAKITREQLATILFRYADHKGYDVRLNGSLDRFPDGGTASGYAADALVWATSKGLISGIKTDGGDTLSPRGSATREQFATILKRFDETDLSYPLEYTAPKLVSSYTEKEYPLVEDADIYVATDGDDGAAGTKDAPIASFSEAVARAAALRAKGKDGVKVAFFAGEYGGLNAELPAEVSGTPDAKTVFCKYGDGDVVFSNGFDFPRDSFEPITEEEKALFSSKSWESIKKADVSAVGASGLDPDDVILYNEVGCCDEARFPNKHPDRSDHLLYAGGYNSPSSLVIISPVLAKRISGYTDGMISGAKIWGNIIRGYRKDKFHVASFDRETGILEIADWQTSEFGQMRDWMGVDGDGIEFCITNVSRELDHENEYWIDPDTATLYVFEPECDYFIPSGERMMTMRSVDDVTFRGLTFKNSAGGFVDAEMCHGLTFELCSFLNTSALKGVEVTDNSLERAMDLRVSECTFANSYGHALYVNGKNVGEHRFDKRENVVFDNNLVIATNTVYDAWNGVHFDYCAGVNVTHNRFERCCRGAISFTQTYDILIEYNDFDSAMYNSHDGGVIYTDWIADARGCTVRYNYFGYVPQAGAGQFGLYLDEFTSGFEIYSNLFFRTGNYCAMFSLGRDNIFRDNVVIGTSEVGWGTCTRDEIDAAGSVEAAAGTWGISYGSRTWGELFRNLESYPAYRAVVEERWPEMLKIHFDYDRIDDPYFALNQTTVVRGNVNISSNLNPARPYGKYESMYSVFEDNEAYLITENPLFVNPTVGDYRIREGVDFPDIQFEKIGRY